MLRRGYLDETWFWVVCFSVVILLFAAMIWGLKGHSDRQDRDCLLDGGVYLEGKNRAVCLQGDVVLEQ